MKAVPFAAREARRLQAWKLRQQGWSRRAIADLLEVSAAAVSRWFKRVRLAGSARALHRRKAPGAAPLLPRACWRELRGLLRRGAVLIRQHFGMADSPRHVGRLLAAMNWSVGRPFKQSQTPRSEYLLCGRKRLLPLACGGAHLRAARPNARPA